MHSVPTPLRPAALLPLFSLLLLIDRMTLNAALTLAFNMLHIARNDFDLRKTNR